MKKAYMARQGDVLIVAVKSIPKKAARASDCVLAHGEVTGHCHQIRTGAHLFVEVDGQKWLDVFDDEATVTHEEHGPVTLPRGRYRVGIQREYEPEGFRNVVD
jgi:hypothetical protein